MIAKTECRTDNHQSYDAVHSIRPVQDKRLIMGTEILREMISRSD